MFKAKGWFFLIQLTDIQWKKIEIIINQNLGNWGGHNANDNRTFINACLYIIYSNSAWHRLPPEYGQYKSVNRRFNRWRKQHIWDDILVVLLSEDSYEWLLFEDGKPTMKWIRMISPSKPLAYLIQRQLENFSNKKRINEFTL